MRTSARRRRKAAAGAPRWPAQLLNRFTDGIISFSSQEFGFEKSCLDAGESTCADTSDPEFSFGFGSMSFCVSCCGPEPEEGRGDDDGDGCPDGGEGAECPVNVPFVDATVICGSVVHKKECYIPPSNSGPEAR